MEDYVMYLATYVQVISGEKIDGDNVSSLLEVCNSHEEGVHQLQIVGIAAYHANAGLHPQTKKQFEEFLASYQE